MRMNSYESKPGDSRQAEGSSDSKHDQSGTFLLKLVVRPHGYPFPNEKDKLEMK